jgi:hypothetical protein
MLAVGSGSAFTSAAFQNSTAPTADLRVVVDQALTVERGDGFDKSNADNVNESQFFNGTNTGSGGDIDDSSGAAFDGSSAPLAYVNKKVNGDLVIKAAQDVGLSHNFEKILKISNDTNEDVDVGIAYDRSASTAPNNQYGAAIENDNVDLSGTPFSSSNNFAQKVYQFRANSLDNGSISYNAGGITNDVISPDPATSSPTQVSGSNNTVSNAEDLPAGALTIPAGDTLQVDLFVDATDADAIEAAASSQNAFGESRETVDIMDAITVGTLDV